MFKCVNCPYEGEEPTKGKFCPICGDNVNLIKNKIDYNLDQHGIINQTEITKEVISKKKKIKKD